MRCGVRQQTLQGVLRVADKIIPKKGGSPAHYAVFLRARAGDGSEEEGRLLVRATNGDVVYSTVLPVENVTDGDVAVPAVQLLAAVEAAPDREVEITRQDGVTRVVSGSAVWTIPDLTGIASDLAPRPWPSDPPGWNQTTLVQHIFDAIERIAYAAARSANRPSLMQIHFNGGRAVAADGRRVHQVAVEGVEHSFDVPVALLDVLMGAIEADTEAMRLSNLTISGWDGFVGYQFGRTSLVAGVLAYEFPDIDVLVLSPARAQTQRLEIAVDQLAQAIRAARVADDQVTLSARGNRLVVQATSSRAQGRMEIPIFGDVGATGRWSVDSGKLLEMLGRTQTGTPFAIPEEGQAGFLFWDDGEDQIALTIGEVTE